MGVALDDIDLGVGRRAADDGLGPVVAPEGLGMDEHRAGHGGIEPRQIQHGLRLASAEEVPAAIDPSLDPSMVVIRMRPAWRIDLAGGDAYGAQGGHQECRFLAAASRRRGKGTEWRGGTRVAGVVSHVLVAPVVDLKNGLTEAKPTHTIPQLGVASGAEVVERLIIDAQGQDEVPPLALGDRLAPGQLLACPQGRADVGQIVVPAAVQQVTGGHIGVEEL